jgi:hypothetical protein
MYPQFPIQNSFSSGELSPWLRGRYDVEQYFRGAEAIENFDVRVSGGLVRRPGTKYITDSADQTEAHIVRVIEFAYARNDAVAIEIFEGGFRFYKDGDVVEHLVGINYVPYDVLVHYGTATAVPYLSAEINQIQFSQSADVLFLTHPNHPLAKLSRYGATDWRYEQVSLVYGPYLDQAPDDQNTSLTLDAATVTDRATLTSSEADFVASVANNIVQYLYSGQKVLGRVVTKTSDYEVVIEPLEDRCLTLSKEVYSPGLYTSWNSTTGVPNYNPTITGSSVNVAFSATSVVTQETVGNYLRFSGKTGAYYWMLVSGIDNITEQGAYGIIAKGNILTVTLPNGTLTRKDRTITATLTSSTAAFFDTTNDVGRKYRLVFDDQVVHATTNDTVTPTTTVMSVTLHRPLPLSQEGAARIQLGTTNDWNKGAFYVGNNPSTLAFHEGRLCLASSTLQPQSLWMSKSADFTNFGATSDELIVSDDSAITVTMDSDTVNQIMWLSSRAVLLVGTAGGEWQITGASSREPITPTNISARNQTSFGSEFIKAISLGSATLYLQKAGHKLRQMVYNYQIDQHESTDLTVFSDHILRDHDGGIGMAYQQLPDPRIFIPMADGQLAVLLYDADQQVYAWSRHVLGGGGKVESLSTVRRTTKFDSYLVVGRTVNGTYYRTIEHIDPDSTVYLDAYVTNTPAAVEFLGGLNMTTEYGTGGMYEVGSTGIKVVTDGSARDGAITIASQVDVSTGQLPTTSIYAGYGYTSTLKSLPIVLQTPNGPGQSRPGRVNGLILKTKTSAGFKHGPSLNRLDYEMPVEFNDPYTIVPASQDIRVNFDGDFGREVSYYIVQDQPYPLSILAIAIDAVQYN